jgi:hypothetical protein
MLPSIVAHADWGNQSKKRRLARAVLHGDSYYAEAPSAAPELPRLLTFLRSATRNGGMLVGFDFPIGVPIAWARRASIGSFRGLLGELRTGWTDFREPAAVPSEISLRRPFYPRRPGGTSRAQLCRALEIAWPDLLRACERAGPTRREACPLFWILGANQVGRGALLGWYEVLLPALEDPSVALWPFDGPLDALLARTCTVIAETYPAEAYGHLGLGTVVKSDARDRARAGRAMLAWAHSASVNLAAASRRRLGSA